MVCARRPRRAKRSGGGGEDAFGVGGAVEKLEHVEDLLGLQAGAFDVEFVDGGFEIGKAAELDPDGGAARGGLRTGGQAQILHGFPGLFQVFGKPGHVGMGREFFQLAAARGAGNITA